MRRTFDLCSISASGTDVEVLSFTLGISNIFNNLQIIHQSGAVMRSGEYRPERPLPGLLAPGTVLSPTRITLENNGKFRPQPDRENAFARASGGESGIRTRDTVAGIHAFQACAFDRSAISPLAGHTNGGACRVQGRDGTPSESCLASGAHPSCWCGDPQHHQRARTRPHLRAFAEEGVRSAIGPGGRRPDEPGSAAIRPGSRAGGNTGGGPFSVICQPFDAT